MLYRIFLTLIFSISFAWSLSIDSLPVWNDSLLENKEFVQENTEKTSTSQLETSGSKTISVVVGDGGTEVDQELKLSMKGYVSDSVYIDAFLSDVGREAGEQNTATLQEVDQIYFRMETPKVLLHLGDLTWKQKNLGFLGINRNTLGVMAGFKTEHSKVRGVFGIDETQHYSVTFNGVDGQRKGYVIDGTSLYLSLVPESERVWLNGAELNRGTDYEINYAGGLIDFKGKIIPTSKDEIRVEYDAYHLGEASRIMGANGEYRSKYLWLDVGGFRLENDLGRLKRDVLDSLAWEILKNDKGNALEIPDSLETIQRPFRTDKASAKMRFAYEKTFLDLETAFYRKDSNTVSSNVKGPSGIGFRWNFMTDSSKTLNKFPVMFGYGGSYLESGFDHNDFSGDDKSFDAYEMKENWDLDSLSIDAKKRLDLLFMRFRMGKSFYGGTEWGYRELGDATYNSMRTKVYVEHFGNLSKSSVSFVHVLAEDSVSSERYQGILSSSVEKGFLRPYAEGNYAFWNREYSGFENEAYRIMHTSGFGLHGENFKINEELKSRLDKIETEKDVFLDSLKQISWTQSSEVFFENINLEHLLYYQESQLEESENSNSWLSSQSVEIDLDRFGFHSELRYDFGLTKEQPYVAIYKKVAAGTGDVLYDSTTGLFIEGVDNGDFVYEGMGRSDSVAVEASNAEFDFSAEWNPGKTFGVHKGFLKDVVFGFELHAESYDTTGRKLFFPALTQSSVNRMSSGLYYGELDVGFFPFNGTWNIHYMPGLEYEKKDLVEVYTEKRQWHRGSLAYSGRKKEIWTLEGLKEFSELNALVSMEWKIWEGNFSYRRELPLGFYIEPGGKLRYGDGYDGTSFDALAKELRLGFGYLWENKANVSVEGSAIHLKTDYDYLPYSLMEGYDKGLTWRVEARGDVSIGDYLSLGMRYLLRVGESKNLFQKWTVEARAYL